MIHPSASPSLSLHPCYTVPSDCSSCCVHPSNQRCVGPFCIGSSSHALSPRWHRTHHLLSTFRRTLRAFNGCQQSTPNPATNTTSKHVSTKWVEGLSGGSCEGSFLGHPCGSSGRERSSVLPTPAAANVAEAGALSWQLPAAYARISGLCCLCGNQWRHSGGRPLTAPHIAALHAATLLRCLRSSLPPPSHLPSFLAPLSGTLFHLLAPRVPCEDALSRCGDCSGHLCRHQELQVLIFFMIPNHLIISTVGGNLITVAFGQSLMASP